MNTGMVRLRKATPEDSRVLWEWRNDPLTRAMSRTSAEIPWEEHEAWYGRALADDTKALLMAEEWADGRVAGCIGTVRFDQRSEGSAEININLDPMVRGRGVGKTVLRAACQYAFENLGLEDIYAEIKPENAASIRIFEALGFVFVSESEVIRAYSLRREGFGLQDD